ncbi:hypothetical protein M413DRAFT_122276 [Hebeloma cylindrosporum]|uniref:Uncharacterized protein n=1 Tax=Hebeloma cylindrosporum TaxID=76867 RepID=A0A0C3CGJ1_HEBCY|nr:hypothetical protein M413DRAFT_122276 [Hebeloma cylindrosporum h7]
MIRKTILRTFNAGGVLYPYTEFLGDGPPSMDLGESGDVYVDLTPGSLALYGRCSKEWKIWAGPQNRKAEDWVVHPSHTDRCLWCSDNSFGWFSMRFARGRPSVHSTASEALTAAKDAQIEKNVERKRKAKEKPELLGPAATKMKLSSTQSRPISTGISSANEPNSLLRPGLNADSSKSTSPTHAPLLQATDPDPNPTRSSSVGSLSSLPSSFGHPTQLFGKILKLQTLPAHNSSKLGPKSCRHFSFSVRVLHISAMAYSAATRWNLSFRSRFKPRKCGTKFPKPSRSWSKVF